VINTQWLFYQCLYVKASKRDAGYRMTSGLDNFSSDDDSDSDNDNVRDDPSNRPILWGPEDEVYHDNALVYTLPGPPHLQVNRLFD
jgi:hypothetical protein